MAPPSFYWNDQTRAAFFSGDSAAVPDTAADAESSCRSECDEIRRATEVECDKAREELSRLLSQKLPCPSVIRAYVDNSATCNNVMGSYSGNCCCNCNC